MNISQPDYENEKEIKLNFNYKDKPVFRYHFSFSGITSDNKVNDVLYGKGYTLPFKIDTLLKLTGYIKFSNGNTLPLPSYQKNNTTDDPVGGRIHYNQVENIVSVNVTPTWLGGIIHIDIEYTRER